MSGWREPCVIVGVSPSLAGLRALRLAVAEAGRRGVTLHAVRAWETTGTGVHYLHDRDEARLVIRECFAAALGGMPPGVPVETCTVMDRPARALVRWARDGDTLFVGRPDRPWWRRRSVARYCVAHATCPVQVVPPDSFAREAARGDLTAALDRELRR